MFDLTYLSQFLIFWYTNLFDLMWNIMYFHSVQSEHINYHSINSYVRMKNKIIYVLKLNALAVFNSHWRNFAAMKPLLFLIGYADQLDVFCPTVSQPFEFWLNASFRPRGKQKTANFCALLCVWGSKLGDHVRRLRCTFCALVCIVVCDVCDIMCVFFALLFCVCFCAFVLSRAVLWCAVMFCVVLCFLLLHAFMWFVWCVLCVVVMCCDRLRCSALFFAAFMRCSVLFCVVMCCAFCAVL